MKNAAIRTTLVWISLAMVGLFFTGLSYAAIDPESIVCLLHFDEGSGGTAADSSGKGNDGTLMGDPQWVDGPFGKALEFDGDGDYVEVAHNDSLTMTDQVTVMFWFRTSKVMAAFGDRQAPVGKHFLEYEVGIYPAGGVHTYTNDGTGGGYDEGINASLAEELPEDDWTVDEWYHLAWTLNGTHEIVYVNGINIGEFDKPNAGTLPGTHTLEIGQRVGGSLPFTGAIDEVAILNVALGEADIQASMTGGVLAVSSADRLATTWATIKTQ